MKGAITVFREPKFDKLTAEIVREYTRAGRALSQQMLDGTYKPPGLVIKNGRLVDSRYTPPDVSPPEKLES